MVTLRRAPVNVALPFTRMGDAPSSVTVKSSVEPSVAEGQVAADRACPRKGCGRTNLHAAGQTAVERQRALTHGRQPGKGVGAAERNVAGAKLGHRSAADNRPREDPVRGLIEGQRGLVENRSLQAVRGANQ